MKPVWLTTLRPRKLPFRRRLSRASVALIYRHVDGGETELLFIQRARREGDPWSGDMAFPGGRMQADDASASAAAQRETREEIGLDLTRHGHFRGRLSDLLTRRHSQWRPMVVTPYVFEWCGTDDSITNHEVQRVVWIPVSFLSAVENQSVRLWRSPLGALRMPCCRYREYCIWGLSYSMLQEFLTSGLIPMASRA
ncbi:NUDIX hydrolase [Marinobacter zhejiangensis]|uniref:8-oxo-dGTP pyrophosphatase MutT, NUDIX family n=1 Tax=Marinobacter zhejiangensis TaxID=488535 RepID=A0A1I4Q4I7_9GAMM|nr:CoA pyrophosphatase [Marinobacter zhejiangensis]SFM34944.1 8-oxo-dGTP pyrophosphatase MutT, NUDIX family [Marinobacter zhejiangensis]